MKSLAIVILNYKLSKQLIESIESIQKSGFLDYQLIVVDNDSKDPIEMDLKKFPEVVFIQTGANLGYSGGNNVGIKEALRLGCEYVLVLNPDTIVRADTLANLMKGMRVTQADIVAPKIYFKDSKIIWYGGGVFDSANVLGSHRGVDQVDEGQFDEWSETDFASGAAMLVKKRVFEKIGFFDEDYFLYYEDADFCYRVKQAGFKIVYYPKAVVYHANAQTTGLGSPRQDYYITRNRMLFAKKHLPFRTQFALLREGLANFGQSVRQKALIDFWLGRFGKRY